MRVPNPVGKRPIIFLLPGVNLIGILRMGVPKTWGMDWILEVGNTRILARKRPQNLREL